MAELADGGDSLEVRVVVEQRRVGQLAGGGDRQVDYRDTPVITRPRQRELQLACPLPGLVAAAQVLQQAQALGALGRGVGVWRSTNQFQRDRRAEGYLGNR